MHWKLLKLSDTCVSEYHVSDSHVRDSHFSHASDSQIGNIYHGSD